jgi:hypothetical protein
VTVPLINQRAMRIQILSETFLILRGIERDMIKKMYVGLNVKYPLLPDFNET